jgi:hypothetical protein
MSAKDIRYVTLFGWTIEIRELGKDKLLMTWGDGHALVFDVKEEKTK